MGRDGSTTLVPCLSYTRRRCAGLKTNNETGRSHYYAEEHALCACWQATHRCTPNNSAAPQPTLHSSALHRQALSCTSPRCAEVLFRQSGKVWQFPCTHTLGGGSSTTVGPPRFVFRGNFFSLLAVGLPVIGTARGRKQPAAGDAHW